MVSHFLNSSFIQNCPMFEIFSLKPIIKLSSIYLTSPPSFPLPPSDSSWVLLISHGLPFLLDSCQDCMIRSFNISHTSPCPHSLVLPHLPHVSSILGQLITCSLCIWVGRENASLRWWQHCKFMYFLAQLIYLFLLLLRISNSLPNILTLSALFLCLKTHIQGMTFPLLLPKTKRKAISIDFSQFLLTATYQCWQATLPSPSVYGHLGHSLSQWRYSVFCFLSSNNIIISTVTIKITHF